eukprot:jgi/Psemu1/255772/estExt_Genewise1Plus.C_1540012
MPAETLPKLPLVCLKTADFKNTDQVVEGKNTVIDFWTTKCTRCPDALDKLDEMARDPKYQDVQFISICCDQLDGARGIIEKDEDLRWQNVNHYFMSKEDKETAKRLLGFQQVPFYVVMDEHGAITQSGSGRQVDFDEVPGVVRPESESDSSVGLVSSSSSDDSSDGFGDMGLDFELDFGNRLSIQDEDDTRGSSSSTSSPVQILDESIFDLEDF